MNKTKFVMFEFDITLENSSFFFTVVRLNFLLLNRYDLVLPKMKFIYIQISSFFSKNICFIKQYDLNEAPS